MVCLDSAQALCDHSLQQISQTLPVLTDEPKRVRQNGQPTSLEDSGRRLGEGRHTPGHEGPGRVVQEAVEGVLDACRQTLLNQHAGEVGPAGDGLPQSLSLPGGHAQPDLLQSTGQDLIAFPTAGVDLLHPRSESRCRWIRQEVPEQMNMSDGRAAGANEDSAELDAADEVEAAIACRRRRRVISGQSVVIGDGQRLKSKPAGLLDQP